MENLSKTIFGYADRWSVRPGDQLAVKVSCTTGKTYQAQLVRIINGDVNPAGPGVKLEAISSAIDGHYSARTQYTQAGSYAVIAPARELDTLSSFTLVVYVWATMPARGVQALLSLWNDRTQTGAVLQLDDTGAASIVLGNGRGSKEVFSTGEQLRRRHWYLISAAYDTKTQLVSICQRPLSDCNVSEHGASVTKASTTEGFVCPSGTPLSLAARLSIQGASTIADSCFNGKIDRPRLARRALNESEIVRLAACRIPEDLRTDVVAAWDFSADISSTTIRDISSNRLTGELINLPARAMKGANWSGREMCWRHAPDEYGAIHFHEDDLYDANWQTDFTLSVPDDLRSGIYAIHLIGHDDEDFVPFVVRPQQGRERSKLAFLVPTASYMAYSNNHLALDLSLLEAACDHVPVLYPGDVFLQEHREFGLSAYDTHVDGSGICYSSYLRPVLNMRPKYASPLGGHGSGLWQFNADTHIIDWLEAKGYQYECLTDEDLHYEGSRALDPYLVVMTGTHPEYWSQEMWDALQDFKRRGGRVIYMGGNGWYWRIAFHPTLLGVIEVRRGEGGTRAWAAEPGEYYHSFTGEYGGLWRRVDKPPNVMCGVGFTAQGFDVSSYYLRQTGSFDARANFIFKNIRDDEAIGDFGLIGGGAAGLELDRADTLLGTPLHALILASSVGHSNAYQFVVEELLATGPGTGGTENAMVRADLVFFETSAGGAVFSTGSIAWAGSLSHNNYDNNVAKITANVLDRFLDVTPFGS